MTPAALTLALALLSVGAFWIGKSRSLALVGGTRGVRHLHSLPAHYGLMTAMWCALPALAVIGLWLAFQDAIILRLVVDHLPAGVRDLSANDLSLVMNDVRNLVAGNVPAASVSEAVRGASAEYIELRGISRMALTVIVMVLSIGAVILVRSRITPELRARNRVELVIEWLLIGCSTIAVFTTIGIVASVAFEAFRFFSMISPIEFLFGTSWSPQMAIREDQVGSSGSFGAVPLFAGTALISFIAMVIAVPIGLFSAIYLAEYAHPKFRTWAKPLLEVLAGVPTVVYGFFAALTIGPALRGWGEGLGLDVASESALAAGFVMGIMIIPFVSSLADDMISAVPQSLRDGAYALGATRSETITAGGAARRAARHRRRRAAGRVARHRRNHDRGDGRGPGCESHRQSTRSRHHRDRSDRHAAGRRPGIRQPEDTRRVCARPGALPGHAGAQRAGTAHRQEIP